jgi:hypothetical protein
MQVLNKYDKEQLVVELYRAGKTMREIASAVHMSFGDIGKIIKRTDGHTVSDISTNLSNKSKETKALWLFEQKKRPIAVAVELDIPYGEVIDLQLEFWALKQLYDLPLVYHELKHDIDSFFKLFKILKKNKMLNERNIHQILRYAGYDLPSLENKI